MSDEQLESIEEALAAAESRELRLAEPVEIKNTRGEVISTVEVLCFPERMIAAHMRGMPVGREFKFDEYLTIAARMTGQPDHVMTQLGISDAEAVILKVIGFLARGRVTGRTSSQSSRESSSSRTRT